MPREVPVTLEAPDCGTGQTCSFAYRRKAKQFERRGVVCSLGNRSGCSAHFRQKTGFAVGDATAACMYANRTLGFSGQPFTESPRRLCERNSR